MDTSPWTSLAIVLSAEGSCSRQWLPGVRQAGLSWSLCSSGCLPLFHKVIPSPGEQPRLPPLYFWRGSVFPEHRIPGKTSLES